MRPSTILLTVLTVVFGVASVVLAVLVAHRDPDALAQVIRLGALVTVGFGAALVISVVNRRRRDRLQRRSAAHPGTEFVSAHATAGTAAAFAAWSPGLVVRFPCDLGFDRNGVTSWSAATGAQGELIATADEITGFDVFDDRTTLGSTSRWGIEIGLAPRSAGPASVRLWLIDGQPAQDEYTMRRTIARIEAALGRRDRSA